MANDKVPTVIPDTSPLQMFREAESHQISAVYLLEASKQFRTHGAFVLSSSLLQAFALEMYLKCLLAVEKTSAWGHPLKNLFEKLQPESATAIRAFAQPLIDRKRPYLAALLSRGAEPESITFDLILSVSSEAFVSLRYLYEPKTKKGPSDPGPAWCAGMITAAVRERILHLRPMFLPRRRIRIRSG